MAFDFGSLIKALMGAGETAGGVATGNPLMAMQGMGSMAQGGSGMLGKSIPGAGSIAGPPAPGMQSGLAGLAGPLGQIGQGLSQGAGMFGSLGGGQKPQAAPIAQHGQPSPFQATQTPQATGGASFGGGGGGSIMELLKKLLGGMQ